MRHIVFIWGGGAGAEILFFGGTIAQNDGKK